MLTEDFGGDFGVTVVFLETDKYPSSVKFYAAEIIAYDDDGPFYQKLGADSSEDTVRDPLQADRYVEGFVKWDGCSHINFGDIDSGYIHICGIRDFTKLVTVIPAIYERCGELIQARGVNLLEGEFKCSP